MSLIIPIPDDVKMSPEESLLFHYAISDDYKQRGYFHVSQFVRTFVAGYGGLLISCPLRHAIIAVAALSLPEEQFGEQRIEYMQKAFHALIEKNEDMIDDADILAAYLLWRTTQSKDQGLVHIKGMVAILDTLQKKIMNSGAFVTLRPLFVEYLLPEPQMSIAQIRHYADEYGKGAKAYPIPTWNDRFNLFDIFQDHRGFERIPGSHFLVRARALVVVLRYDYFDILCALQLMHEEELKGVEKVPYVSMGRFEEVLASRESQQLLQLTDLALYSRIDSQWEESTNLTLACLSNLACHLSFLILKGDTILQGMQTVEFKSMSARFVSMIRVSSNLRPTHLRLLRSWLFLAGLGLSSLKSEETSNFEVLII